MAKHANPSELLDDLSRMGSYGRAESEDAQTFPKTFHPVAEHARAFDPNVVLVVGPRGAGKSELFRAAVGLKLLPAIEKCLPAVRLSSSTTGTSIQWRAGYPIAAEFPDARGLAAFLREKSPDRESAVDLWFAYLVRVFRAELAEQDTQQLAPLMEPLGGDADAVRRAFSQLGNKPLLAMDRLDGLLVKRGEYVFIGYDELDTLGASDWTAMGTAIRGLVAFWARYSRRWERIRAKVFLRTDLFQRYATEGGADLAKLAANRVELVWSDRNLYAMLLKRIANSSDRLFKYVKETRTRVEFRSDPALGQVPDFAESVDIRPIVERLVGPYMGATFKKGMTYRWLINHIRDGLGQALPRPLVRLVEVASETQRYSEWPRLIEPTSLRRALDRVSLEQVQHSLDEWPWLDGLKKRLGGVTVPWPRNQLERRLEKDWEEPWGDDRETKPPVETPPELVDYLTEVGILRARSRGRVDAADLYLAGLGLKRKGGVRKRMKDEE
jgi:hypothetical protein